MGQKDEPISRLSSEERENIWDDLYIKEEGIILEFDPETNSGKIRSLVDGDVYLIDGHEEVRTKIDLKAGVKVLFAPIEDAEGLDYARILRIVELSA